METKTTKAVALFKEGKIKEALRIFKTFKMGFSKFDKTAIEIAYECMTGHESFYKSIGINTKNVIEDAKRIIATKYNLN